MSEPCYVTKAGMDQPRRINPNNLGFYEGQGYKACDADGNAVARGRSAKTTGTSADAGDTQE